MKAGSGNRVAHTVLVVADDLRLLMLAQAILTGKGHLALVANDAQKVVQVLNGNHPPVHSVAIRAGMRGYAELQDWSFRRGAKPWTLCCAVDDRSVQLEGMN